MTATGWVAIDKNNPSEYESMVDYGCITTTPDKRCKLKSEGNVKRAQFVSNKLIEIIDKYSVKVICTELPSGSQNASAATQLSLVVGSIIGITQSLKIPISLITPRGLKKIVTGSSTASKKEVINTVKPRFKMLDLLEENDMTNKKWEAVGDATGAYISLKNDDIVLASTGK